MRIASLRPFSIAMLSILATAGAASAADQPVGPRAVLRVQPGLSDDDKEATNVSGAACAVLSGAERSCLLIGDEVRYARFFTLVDDKLHPGKPLYLLPKKDDAGKKLDETDAEGVAFDGKNYYLIGSHGLNKSGEKQPSRYFIYRVSVDPSNGLAGDLGDKDHASTSVRRSANLDGIIDADTLLHDSAATIPEDGGVNIEGLAVANDQLYVGFRSPLVDGKALIASMPVAAAFDDPAARLTFDKIDLGEGQAVRDLAAVEDGVLILSGPQLRVPGPARVFLWQPGSAVRPLAEIDRSGFGEGQPEVLTVLARTPNGYSVLVMADGSENGAPAIYDIPR